MHGGKASLPGLPINRSRGSKIVLKRFDKGRESLRTVKEKEMVGEDEIKDLN